MPKPARERDPRLPAVGTEIVKTHKGEEHRVLVLDDGFEYRGERFKSLSAVAKAATGQVWNGYLWAGLIQRPAAAKKGGDA